MSGLQLRLAAAAAIAIAVLMGGPTMAASGGVTGIWDDNASQGLTIGKLDVRAASVEVGRKVTYGVKTLQDNGAGAILKVTGSDRRRDPFGCGPNARVTYLVLEPLAPTPGTTQQAMRLIFYGSDHVPDLRTLETDHAVCAVHPYGRLPLRAAPSRHDLSR